MKARITGLLGRSLLKGTGRSRPCVTTLEDRSVPALIVVTGTGDNVSVDGLVTLREAVQSANADADANSDVTDQFPGTYGTDTIVFNTGQLTQIWNGGSSTATLTRFVSPTTVTLGSELSVTNTLTINGTGANILTINGNSATRHFTLTSTTVTINNLTLANGSATANGGSINSSGTNLTLNSVEVTNTKAGSGIRTAGSSLTLNDCRVTNNVGGGINANGTNVTITRSTISGNTTVALGGGLYFFGGAGLTMVASTVADNLSNGTVFGGGGGGICLSGSVSSSITNSTIYNNKAVGANGGGDVFVFSITSVLTVNNSTIAQNTASGGFGGGISVPNASSLLLSSTLIGGNSSKSTGLGADVEVRSLAGIVTADFCLIQDPVMSDGSNVKLSGSNNILSTNPLLGTFGDNGAPTQTYSLQSTSPAIDKGTNAGSLAFDQRGTDFVRDSGTLNLTDIGAFEFQAANEKTVRVNTSLSTINGGATQRSMVRSVEIVFTRAVTIANPATAFQLTRNSDSKDVTISSAVLNGQSAVTLYFTGGTPYENGSLADGRYTLTAFSAGILSNGRELDGDANGTPGGNYVLLSPNGTTDGVYRLFGDMDGDTDVDNADFVGFRNAIGLSGAFDTIFDWDADHDVDLSDYNQFKSRYGTKLP